MTGILARNSITVSPTYTDAQIMERVKGDPKDGKATRFALVRGSFVFSHAEDGSSVSCACYGEAMDSGDKAMTKAQSVAFRTALFQFFVIPTVSIDPESDGDDSEGAEPQALGLDAVKLMLDNIASSKTSERLQAVWVDAQALAGSAKDATALKEFKDAITAVAQRGSAQEPGSSRRHEWPNRWHTLKTATHRRRG
jgi:hypothetical protein